MIKLGQVACAAKLGVYLSLSAGLFETGLSWMFARWLSEPGTIIILALIVLFGAILVRIGVKIPGGLIIIGFSYLWWYYGMGDSYIDQEAFMINLRSPLGVISTVGLALGIVAGALDIIAATLTKFLEK